MKVVSCEKMADIDGEAQKTFFIPPEILMENAGIRALEAWRDVLHGGKWKKGKYLFIAGGGNNGGDALVMARSAWISGVEDISIILVSERHSAPVSLHIKICAALGLKIQSWERDPEKCKEEIQEAAVIFDGINGTGIKGALREDYVPLVHHINRSKGEVVAIDLPSGLGDNYKEQYPAVRASVTLTLGLPKLCLYLPLGREYCGKILTVKIGFPNPLIEDPKIPGELLSWDRVRMDLPRIPKTAYKNLRGHVGVFAGNRGTLGAAVLCAKSADRALAGLVTLFVDSSIYPIAASLLLSCLVKPWDGNLEEIDLGNFNSLCLGPGWGLSGRESLLKHLLSLGIPGVIDADGITLLSRFPEPVNLEENWVLTPHLGEFCRLSRADKHLVLKDPLSYLLPLCGEWNTPIVLKGHVSYIGNPDGRYWILDGMNPCLGTGGSGDLLAGIIAGLLATGIQPLEAALTGVALHDRIGKLAAAEQGWFTAEDLLPYISKELICQE